MNDYQYIAHGSPEWYEARCGKFTPSEVHKLMTIPPSGDLSKGAITYIKTKVSEILTLDFSNNEPFSNMATDWGNQYEDEAINIFADVADTEIIRPGFIIRNEYFGGTPDGLDKEHRFGIEVKCPFNPSIHLDNLLLNSVEFKKVRKPYYWQMQAYMALTGIPEWYFISYDPRQVDNCKMKVIKMDRCDEDVVLLRERMKMANEYKTQLLETLNANNG